MTAKELAEKLLEHPHYLVKVGVEQHLFGDTVLGYDYVEERMIDVDETNETIENNNTEEEEKL